MHVTKVAMVVDAGFVVFFVVALVKLEVWGTADSNTKRPNISTITTPSSTKIANTSSPTNSPTN